MLRKTKLTSSSILASTHLHVCTANSNLTTCSRDFEPKNQAAGLLRSRSHSQHTVFPHFSTSQNNSIRHCHAIPHVTVPLSMASLYPFHLPTNKTTNRSTAIAISSITRRPFSLTAALTYKLKPKFKPTPTLIPALYSRTLHNSCASRLPNSWRQNITDHATKIRPNHLLTRPCINSLQMHGTKKFHEMPSYHHLGNSNYSIIVGKGFAKSREKQLKRLEKEATAKQVRKEVLQGSHKVVALAITRYLVIYWHLEKFNYKNVRSNALMFMAKLYAATISGSASMFAESLHSLADMLNESLLMYGKKI
jgi:hypothetical protein